VIACRISGADKSNEKLRKIVDPRPSNTAWIEKHGGELMKPGSLLLLGGTSVLDFRLRVAQAHVRHDLMPSYWSHVAIVRERKDGAWILNEVSLDPPGGFGDVSGTNAIQTAELRRYRDHRRRWPNIAILSFPAAADQVLAGIERLAMNRNLVDLASLILAWLAFGWGAGRAANPLLEDKGLPSGVFAETVMGLAGLELTPGLSSRSSCPEAIWQAAKWWHGFYKQTGGAERAQEERQPAGIYRLGQPSAAIVEPAARPQTARRKASPSS
jgi:hypothetical protein